MSVTRCPTCNGELADTDVGTAELLRLAKRELALATVERTGAAIERTEAARDRAVAEQLRNEMTATLKIASTDELTGAWTRRFGLDEVSRELERASRTGTSLVVVFIDVDGLKQVNDDHGHLAGDELLALIGEVVRAHLRPYDVVVRYGGDEFVCAMPDLTAAEARARFAHIADVLTIVDPAHSISFGVALAHPTDTLQRLIIRADEDLLAARATRAKA